jgi:hypothetical protein
VQTDIQDRGILFKDVLGSIAMVDVPIEDGYLRQPVIALRVSCTNGNVIKEAETHGPVALGMMSRRSDGTECRVDVAVGETVDCLYHASGSKKRNIERLLDSVSVSLIKQTSSPPGNIPDEPDVFL